jgi:hypothetical protein
MATGFANALPDTGASSKWTSGYFGELGGVLQQPASRVRIVYGW